MVKLNKKIIISIALVIIFIMLFMTSTLAVDTNRYDPRDAGPGQGLFLERAGKILGIIRVVGIVVSIGVLMVVGIKFIFAGVEQKAEYKKTMIPYVIGAVMLFSIITIVTIIESIAKF